MATRRRTRARKNNAGHSTAHKALASVERIYRSGKGNLGNAVSKFLVAVEGASAAVQRELSGAYEHWSAYVDHLMAVSNPKGQLKYITVTVGHPEWSSGYTEDYEVQASSIGDAKRILAAQGFIIKRASDQKSMLREIKKWAHENPGQSAGMRAYRAYYSEKKALGWSPKKIRAYWKRKRDATKSREQASHTVATVAYGEIEKAADRIFPPYVDSLGRTYSGSYPYMFMLDVDEVRNTIQARLDRSRDTKSAKGWSALDADNPEFVKILRKIQKKYQPKGLKMTIVVRNNPSRRRTSRRNPSHCPTCGR